MKGSKDFNPLSKEDNPQWYAATKSNLEPIFRDIQSERFMQDGQWKGPDHDDTHNSHDWLAFILKHAGRAVIWPWDREKFREQMVKVAALAVAAIQWCDRLEKEQPHEPSE